MQLLERLRAIFSVASGRLDITDFRPLASGGREHLAIIRTPARSHRVFVYLAPSGEPRYVDQADGAYRRYLKTHGRQRPTSALFIGERMSALAISRCREAELGFIDPANNSYHILLEPYCLERIVPMPRYERRRGPGAAFSPPRLRVIRALMAGKAQPWHQKALAQEAGVSVATVNSLVNRLEDDGYLLRSGKGPLQTISLKRERAHELLDEWAKHWQSVEMERYTYYGSTPLTEALMQTLAQAAIQRELFEGDGLYDDTGASIPIAFTGLAGALKVTPYVGFDVVVAYTLRDPDLLARRARLHPVDEGANVRLLVPPDDGVFYGVKHYDGVPVVSLPQLYVDLIAAGGRAAGELGPMIAAMIPWCAEEKA